MSREIILVTLTLTLDRYFPSKCKKFHRKQPRGRTFDNVRLCHIDFPCPFLNIMMVIFHDRLKSKVCEPPG